MTDYSQDEPAENPAGWNITPGWMDPSGGLIQSPQFGGDLQHLNNVDIILTSDKTKWSRCVVVETANIYFTVQTRVLDYPQKEIRRAFSQGQGFRLAKKMLTWTDFLILMEVWMPMDLLPVWDGSRLCSRCRDGERLNIFFGENSVYDSVVGPSINVGILLTI
jgi:hypothetical protein